MLPIRQSCDRCHEHKVRCNRDIPEKTVPCARCTRAGTPCIYSIQQKPGRKLSSREATPRLPSLATRTHSAKNPASLDLISDDVICSNGSKPDNQMLSGDRPSDEWLHSLDTLTASLSPMSNTTTDDGSYFCTAALESSLDPTQTYIEQLAKLVISIGRSISTVPSPAGKPSLSASSPPFSDICTSASSLIMIMTQVSQPNMRENERDVDMLELDSHLNPIPTFDYLPSHLPPDRPAGPAALLGPGTLMMILACYQRLLEAFETICLFMEQRLHEMEMNSLMGFSEQHYLPLSSSLAQRSRSISPPSLFPTSDTLQFIMMTKLTSDLLSRLDRALGPLVGNVDKTTSHGSDVAGHPRHDISPGPSSSSSSSSSSTTRLSSEYLSDKTPALINGDVSTESDETRREVAEARSTGNILAMKAGEQLRQQQSRLRAQIKVVKRLVRSQRV